MLIDKLKMAGLPAIAKTFKGVALVSLLVLNGCETVYDPSTGNTQTQFEHFMDAISSPGIAGPIAHANAGLADTPEKAAAWGALGRVYDNAHELEVAREGRSQVNVNVQQPNYNNSAPNVQILENRFDDNSCCHKAFVAGRNCRHICCVEARNSGEICKKCNLKNFKLYNSQTNGNLQNEELAWKKIFSDLQARIPAGQTPYLFLYNNWVDENGDKLWMPAEVFGIKDEFNIDGENMRVTYIFRANKGSNVINFKLRNESGELLAESAHIRYSTEAERIKLLSLERTADTAKRRYSDPKDVMDKLEELPSGKYVITATANGGQLRRADFVIRRESAASNSE